MHYSTLLLAAVSAASALPGVHKAGYKHHHRRNAEAAVDYDTSGVNWAEALADVNWASVNFNQQATTASTKQEPTYTTTVAVVGTEAPATTQAPSTTLAASTRIPLVSNVASAAVSTSSAAAAPAATTSSSSSGTSSSSSLSMPVSSDEYSIEVVNNCGYTVWQAGWQTNTAGALISSQVKGNEMSAGSSISLAIPKAALGVQLWARTGCIGSGSSFTCEVGDCQGFECTSIIWQDGPILAEFGSGLNTDIYNTDITAYDISAIPGNNVGIEIVPSISSCERKLCPVTGCSTSQAWLSASDTDLGCPADTTCSNDANFTVTFCPA